MKILIALCLLVLQSTFISAQSYKTKEALESIGDYELDDNGNVTFVRIIELDSLTKDEIFNRAEEYFVYKYSNGQSVIQIKDKEGGRIIGKGLYSNTAWVIGLVTVQLSTWHILRIDVKDGKARLTITLTDYDETFTFDGISSNNTSKISMHFPIVKDGRYKNAYGQGFAESYTRALLSFDELEDTLLEGTTFKNADKDW